MQDRSQMAYRTVRDAVSALSLDVGYNPFTTGEIPGRPTKAALARLGYRVDAVEWRRRQRENWTQSHCCVCGCELAAHDLTNDEGTMRHDGFCRDHRRWDHMCDNGHQWAATDAEAAASDHRCPICGEYAV